MGRQMRVALCFSGMIRTLDRTYPNIRAHLLEPLHPDVFIHTYDRMGLSKENDTEVSEAWLDDFFRPATTKIVSLEENNTRFLRERDRLYSLPGPIGPGGIARETIWKLRNVLSQLWHVQQCDFLRQEYEAKQGFHYDLVIRARTDNLFLSTPNPLGQLGLSSFPEKTVFVPDHAAYGGVCDQFAMGERESMRAHCDYYSHFEETFCSRPLLLRYYGAAEGLLKRYHLRIAGLTPVAFRFPFEIQRENETQIQGHVDDAFFRKHILKEAA